jgi:membrane associated rhomboid family serine protease
VTGSGWNRFGNQGAPLGMGPAVFLLLVANVAVFMLQLVIAGTSGRDPIGQWFSFVPYFAIERMQIWRFVTYMFLHGDLMHLFFNMFGLWIFGMRIEQLWGTRTFAWYYFVSGIGGAILYGIFSLAGMASLVPMVGASAAVYGILLAFGLAFPNATLFLFFVVPVPARIAVVIFGLMALFGVGGANIAHLAHLGGMVTGLIFLWLFTGGRITQPPRLPGRGGAKGGYRTVSGQSGPGYRTSYGRPTSTWEQLRQAFLRWRTRMRLKVVGDGQKRTGSGRGSGSGAARPGNGRPLGREDRERVDEILEKISREGLQSLTPDEQDILRRASRKD